MSLNRLLLLGLFLLGMGGVRAAEPSPSETLLRHVPSETSICLVVRDLRQHLQQLSESPFLEWYQRSAFAKRYNKPEQMKAIRDAIHHFAAQLKITPEQLIDDILGDAIVFAFQPGDNEADESGVILVHARKPATLTRLIERINTLQLDSGELRNLREVAHQGQIYFIRERSNQAQEYYYLHGPLFAFSGQRSAIESIIEHSSATDSPIVQSLKRLGIEEAFMVLWFDPRRFDQELAREIEQADNESERPALRQFQKIWQATQALALTLDLNSDLDLGLVAQINESQLPDSWQPILFPPVKTNLLWNGVPDNAILSFGGRINIPEMRTALRSIMSPAERKKFDESIERDLGALVGKSRLEPMLAGIGPNWLFWIAPPDGDEWVPTTQAVVALGGEKPDAVARSVKQAIDLSLQFIRVQHNREHELQLDYRGEPHGDALVQCLDYPLFPKGFRPGYAIIAHHLVIGGHPKTVAAFKEPDTNESSDRLAHFSSENLRNYLVKQIEPLSEAIARSEGRDTAKVRAELEELTLILELFRTVKVDYHTKENRIAISAHVKMIKPLKKQ